MATMVAGMDLADFAGLVIQVGSEAVTLAQQVIDLYKQGDEQKALEKLDQALAHLQDGSIKYRLQLDAICQKEEAAIEAKFPGQ